MRIEYGDDGQAAIAQYVRWSTLSKLLSFTTVPIVYGRFDSDDGDDDETIASSERIGNDGDEEEEDGA